MQESVCIRNTTLKESSTVLANLETSALSIGIILLYDTLRDSFLVIVTAKEKSREVSRLSYEPIEMFVPAYDPLEVTLELAGGFRAARKILQLRAQVLELAARVEHQHGDEAVAAGVRDGGTISREYLTHADHLENRATVNVEGEISRVEKRTRRVASPPRSGDREQSQDDVDGHHGLREHRAPDGDLAAEAGAPHHRRPFPRRLRRAPILVEEVDERSQSFQGANRCRFESRCGTVFSRFKIDSTHFACPLQILGLEFWQVTEQLRPLKWRIFIAIRIYKDEDEDEAYLVKDHFK